jgi:cytochrome c oxidase subunit 3
MGLLDPMPRAIRDLGRPPATRAPTPMSAHAEADHHHHGPITDWPADPHMGKASPGKIAMWIFLLSDAMSFGGLLLGYAILRARADQWVKPGEPEFGINFTAGLTFLLICSSVTMVLAVAAAMERDRKGTVKFLALTIFGGVLFLCGQLQEYWGTFAFIFDHHGLIAEGLTWGASARATTFYIITSFHGMHVLTGVLYMTAILIGTLRGKYDDGNHSPIEICGLFWHFVDLVWILVFTFVYLIPEPMKG